MVNFNQYVGSGKYIKRQDLLGRNRYLVVARTEIETLDEREPQKIVLYFQGVEKGLVMNATNLKAMADLYNSEETNDWNDKVLGLTVRPTSYGGTRTLGLRVIDKWELSNIQPPADANEYKSGPSIFDALPDGATVPFGPYAQGGSQAPQGYQQNNNQQGYQQNNNQQGYQQNNGQQGYQQNGTQNHLHQYPQGGQQDAQPGKP